VHDFFGLAKWPLLVVVGVFDGVHVGHHEVMRADR
jgi:FAD synthase